MNPPRVQLREIADLQLGVTLRGADASRHDPHGTHQLIRIGDITAEGDLRPATPNLVRLDESTARRYELRPGDVVLAARGARLTAAVFAGACRAVAGSQFCVIRVHRERLLPAYLCWFLNLPSSQEVLGAGARGSYIRSLSLGPLGEFEVPVPPLPRQEAIAELRQLRIRERELMAALAERRSLLIDHAILKSLSV